MTDQHPENNRVLHELFGKCWHENLGKCDYGWACSCERIYPDINLLHRHIQGANPDYAADPRLVLEGMREKNRLGDFLIFLCRQRITVPEMSYRIDVDLILDKTGRLEDLAIEFFKEEGK